MHQLSVAQERNNITLNGNATLTHARADACDSGSIFDVIVSNGCGPQLTSSSATLTVNLRRAAAQHKLFLEGQSKNSTTWIASNAMAGRTRVDPARLRFCAADYYPQTINISFDHTKRR